MDIEAAIPAEEVPAKFHRSLSGIGVVILTLSMLSPGVSIFVGGAAILQQVGTGAVLAFLIGSLVCYCQTSMSAELGAAYPTAGADYAAIGHAVGDWAGATCYIATIVNIPLFLNTSAVGIAIYLQPLGIPISANGITLLMVALITVLAMLNIRANEYITGIFIVIEFAALLLVAAVGVWHVRPDAASLVLHPMHMHEGAWLAAGIGIVGIAVNNASWNLAGASQALMFSEDMKRPQTVGRIIMIAFALTVFFETAPVIGTIVGAHDLRAVLSSDTPFEAFLGQYLPSFVRMLVSLSIAIAIFNACLAGFIGIGRNVFAMGRTHLFAAPINHAVTRLIASTDAPWVAIALIGVSTAAATYIPLYFKLLLLSGSYTFLTIFYVAGVVVGRRSGRTGKHFYRTPLFPLVPLLGGIIVIGEIVVLCLDPELGRKSLAICGAIYLLAYLYYRFILMRRSEGWTMIGPEDIDAMAGVR
jgi:amino acid transporter